MSAHFLLSALLALPLALPLALAAPAAVAQDGHAAHAHQHAAFQSDRIHVRVDGAEGAPDVVLIPGLSSSPAIWQQTVDRLAATHRIHRIHVQGFAGAPAKGNAQEGDTPSPLIAPVAEDIARYIRENGLNKPAVIGHSLGGTLGMMVAARHPDQVGKLMVVDMVPFVGAMFGAPGATVETVTPVADQMWALQKNMPAEAYQAAATQTINGMINASERREEALSHMRASDQAVSAAAYRELMLTDLRAELPNITAPTTVLYVKFNDARMTDEVTDLIYRTSFASQPAITLKRIDDSAHFIMFDQPEVFAAEVDAFLTSN